MRKDGTASNRRSSKRRGAGAGLFAELTEHFADVERIMLFGFDCLRARRKVFAKLVDDQVVLRLPARRISVLLDEKRLAPYLLHERPMSEWAIVAAVDGKDMIALAEEARAFAEGK